MKIVIKLASIFILTLFFTCPAAAQGDLWEALPVHFNNFGPRVMYYDSIDEVSYIAGTFSEADDSLCNIVKYDGSTFIPLPSSPLYETFCLARYNNKIYAGGYGLASWDGNSWTYLDSTHQVNTLYPYNGKLYVGGNFNSIGNSSFGSAAVWNDTAWSDFYGIDDLLGTTGWSIISIVNYKNRFYVGGNFNNLNDTSIKEIAVFDGQSWKNVGSQVQGDGLAVVQKLLIWKDTLYVSGQFYEASGSPGNGIAKWDGTNWHKLNKGLMIDQPSVTDLMVLNDELYAVGWFNTIDGIELDGYFRAPAKWDGSKWCSMGTASDNVITKLGRFKDSLYVLGGFHQLNDQTINYIAKWIGGEYTDTCSSPDDPVGVDEIADRKLDENIEVYPNPSINIFYIDLKNFNKAKMVMADFTGKIVKESLLNASKESINIEGFSSGIYYLKITSETKTFIKKLVLLDH
jgi:hypothetical protein